MKKVASISHPDEMRQLHDSGHTCWNIPTHRFFFLSGAFSLFALPSWSAANADFKYRTVKSRYIFHVHKRGERRRQQPPASNFTPHSLCPPSSPALLFILRRVERRGYFFSGVETTPLWHIVSILFICMYCVVPPFAWADSFRTEPPSRRR